MDTNILKAMSPEEVNDIEKYPGPLCRDFIDGLVEKCHRLIISKKLWEEYKKHISSYSRKKISPIIRRFVLEWER